MALSDHGRDFALIALGVGLLFGALFAYSGVWPPVVVVETNSMMHVDVGEYNRGSGDTRADGVRFGRIGTMDPGDLILIKEVDGLSEIRLAVAADEGSYNGEGDVVAYTRPNTTDPRPIIHRAVTRVFVQGEGEATNYRVLWSEDWAEGEDCARSPVYVCEFNATGVTVPELGLVRKAFSYGGLITQGDNQASNPQADQAGRPALMPEPVRAQDLVGKAQGEAPAIGLLRLAFGGSTIKNADMADHDYFLRIGNVVAPVDLWALLVLELALFMLSPGLTTVIRDWTSSPDRKVTGELSVLEQAWRETTGRGR